MSGLMGAGTLELVELDTCLDFDLPCESVNHVRGLYGHDPNAPAAFAVTWPCCGRTELYCRGWVSILLSGKFRGYNHEPTGCGAEDIDPATIAVQSIATCRNNPKDVNA